MQNEINFGKNLRVLRSERGVSQQELADAIHVTRQSISKWERGAGKPDIYYLHDVCQYFDMGIGQMMYGNVLTDNFLTELSACEADCLEINYNGIKLCGKGLNVITDEDLEEFFNIIRYDLKKISVTAMTLNKHGYTITEVFDNGFSVFLKSDLDAVHFKKDLFHVLDCFIHHDDVYIEKEFRTVEEIIDSATYEVLEYTMKEILGADRKDFKYYWVDEMENPRGYAYTEQECKEQAFEQECKHFKVLSVV